jgi:hypothetical protein
MAWAVATNLARDATNIFSKASVGTESGRVSTTACASYLGDSQEVERTLLFLFLKTGRGWLIAAVLVHPTKLADLDAWVTGDLRFSLASRSKCVSKPRLAGQSAMRFVFNGKEKLRSLSN